MILAGFLLAAVLQEAPTFEGVAWVGRAPELAGKVALVRWWTSGCSLCETSAPVLRKLSEKAAVVAIFHPKPPRDVEPARVKEAAASIGMPGALGVDRDWKVLERWKAGKAYAFTSLTFLVDRKGLVRYVHPGGALSAEDGEELGRRIEALLAEKE
jgi:thiol-disulfide isomerase/thioredoxin